jgi:hypothetical protein
MTRGDTGQPRIRAAELVDLPALQDIERAAGLCFRDLGMPEVADYEPPR